MAILAGEYVRVTDRRVWTISSPSTACAGPTGRLGWVTRGMADLPIISQAFLLPGAKSVPPPRKICNYEHSNNPSQLGKHNLMRCEAFAGGAASGAAPPRFPRPCQTRPG